MKVTFFFTSTKVGFQLLNIGYVAGVHFFPHTGGFKAGQGSRWSESEAYLFVSPLFINL